MSDDRTTLLIDREVAEQLEERKGTDKTWNEYASKIAEYWRLNDPTKTDLGKWGGD